MLSFWSCSLFCCLVKSSITVDPFPNDEILDSSKLEEFADDNLKFDENDRKSSKCIGNTVGKGEIARYEQFLLFPQRFQKAFSQGRQKASLCGNGLTDLP